jgi:hypothetical protein
MSKMWRYRVDDGSLPEAREEWKGTNDDGVKAVGRMFDDEPGGDWVDSPAKVAASKPAPKKKPKPEEPESE